MSPALQANSLLLSHQESPKGRVAFPLGDRTPVSCVTGGDTHHYTKEDSSKSKILDNCQCLFFPKSIYWTSLFLGASVCVHVLGERQLAL